MSYASEDAALVLRIKAALEGAGIDVFFDREQLMPGDDWEAKLVSNIHKCSLFLPIVSKRTLTPDRRYFRAEWNLALKEARMSSFGEGSAFLIPVLVDETSIEARGLPASFREIQWESLPDGQPTAKFVERIRSLYRSYQKRRACEL